jgi:ribosomal protein S18 acetylase RimI-like enzyme
VSTLDPPLVRPATEADGAALAALMEETWLPTVSPGYGREPGPFLDRTPLEDVLLAELDGSVVGYVLVNAPATPLPSNAHVALVNGLGVTRRARRRRVAETLMVAAEDRARAAGCRKLRLRVLGANAAARSLYAHLGYETEGVLHAEFLLPVGPDGAEAAVDDVLLAKWVR